MLGMSLGIIAKSSVIKLKGESQDECFKKTKHAKFSEKTNTRVHTYVHVSIHIYKHICMQS